MNEVSMVNLRYIISTLTMLETPCEKFQTIRNYEPMPFTHASPLSLSDSPFMVTAGSTGAPKWLHGGHPHHLYRV